jgi:hypothetical protein
VGWAGSRAAALSGALVALALPAGPALASKPAPPAGPSGPGGPTVTTKAACAAAREQLLSLMANARGATGASYENRDPSGFTTDTIKIIQIPQGYLGVYHVSPDGVNFSVRLGFSSNLVHWYYVTTLATGASQPTISALPSGAFLVAYEKDDPGGLAHLEFRDYPSIDAIATGAYDAQFDAPRTLSRIGEGTPNIRSVTTNGSLLSSTIHVGFHYYDKALGRDREGLGTLTDFTRWDTQVNTALDNAFHPMPGGEIGGRDYLSFKGCPFTVVEAQSVLGNWGSWHVYLYDETSSTMTQVPVRTIGGSTSLGNPKVAVITDPNGKPALVVSYFIFAQNVAPGEAGPLVFYTEF